MQIETVMYVRIAKKVSKICLKLRHITPITYVSSFLQVCKMLHDYVLRHSLAQKCRGGCRCMTSVPAKSLKPNLAITCKATFLEYNLL